MSNNPYVDGAIMAYKDCAELMERFKKNVPPELIFTIPLYDQCARAFLTKADHAKKLAEQAGREGGTA